MPTILVAMIKVYSTVVSAKWYWGGSTGDLEGGGA